MSICARILYSLDHESQFDLMDDARKSRRRNTAAHEKRVNDWKAQFKVTEAFGERVVQVACMAEHMQSKLVVGRMYSMAGKAAALPTLDSAIKPHHMSIPKAMVELDSTMRGSLTLDIDDAPERSGVALASGALGGGGVAQELAVPESPPAVEERVFFRVTCPRPSLRKLVPLPAVSSKGLSPSDLCVTIHHSHRVLDSTIVDVEPASAQGIASPIAVLSACRADTDVLQSSLTSWSTRKDLTYGVEGMSQQDCMGLQVIVKSMVRSRAFDGGESYYEVLHSDHGTCDLLDTLHLTLVVRSVSWRAAV
jgi:hypothetical protein